MATALALLAPAVPAAAQMPPTNPIIALHVPWAIGGPRIETSGELVMRAPEWPAAQIRAVRLWDTRTAWLNLQPARDTFDWTNLDAHLAQARANGVEHITLVLWGTPTWAARSLSPLDAPWLGPGSASPPSDLADWRGFVAAVAQRYRGMIDAYEIGNEPEEPMFWRGTPDELSALVVSAAAEINAVDPSATIVAPIQARIPAGAVDALAFHWYPTPGTDPMDLRAVVRAHRADLRARGLGGTPLWLTEVNLRPASATHVKQLADIRRLHRAAIRARLPYLAWYAWTDQLAPEFIDLQQPGALLAITGTEQRRR